MIYVKCSIAIMHLLLDLNHWLYHISMTLSKGQLGRNPLMISTHVRNNRYWRVVRAQEGTMKVLQITETRSSQ